MIDINRRELVGTCGAGVVLGGLAPRAFAAATSGKPTLSNRLVLYTLYGGNDGLNTLVPFRDPRYRHLRPTLSLAPNALLPISDDLAFHPALKTLRGLYERGEVAVVQDVGVNPHNLSHFEAMDIWDSAEPRKDHAATRRGWFGNLVNANRAAFDRAGFDAHGVSFDTYSFFGDADNVSVLGTGKDLSFLRSLPPRVRKRPDAAEPVRALIDRMNLNRGVMQRVATRARNARPFVSPPQDSELEVQRKLFAWFLAAQVRTPVMALMQGGFDTHQDLLPRHRDLLGDFDTTLDSLRATLVAQGEWTRTTILVHSEFGRRASENGGGGTDHGTAGPVFLIGGGVRGGVYGTRASLDDLDDEGNLKSTTDLRSIYSSIAVNLWGLQENAFAGQGFAPLPITLAQA